VLVTNRVEPLVLALDGDAGGMARFERFGRSPVREAAAANADAEVLILQAEGIRLAESIPRDADERRIDPCNTAFLTRPPGTTALGCFRA
jgi:hypothetical protein